MKDSRIYLRLESDKKRQFIISIKQMKTSSTKILTEKIDEVIKENQIN